MNELALPGAPASDLPAVAKEAEEAWTKIEQSNLGDRMKSALRRIACGESIRDSAEAEGYSSTLMSTDTPSGLELSMCELRG